MFSAVILLLLVSTTYAGFIRRVRLAGGAVPNEGRLEVYYDGEWGTVCDDGFDDVDATVACKGLERTSGEVLPQYTYDYGSGPIMLDNVNCDGSEAFVGDCDHNGWKWHNCDHGEDVAIRCHIGSVGQDDPSTKEWHYELVTQNMNWSSASTYCHDHFDGRGRLAVIHNKEEQDALKDYMYLQLFIGSTQICFRNAKGLYLWTAGKRVDQSSESEFVWSLPNGRSEPMTYTNWHPGQPDFSWHDKNEGCLNLWPGHDYQWNDAPCDYTVCFVCEVS